MRSVVARMRLAVVVAAVGAFFAPSLRWARDSRVVRAIVPVLAVVAPVALFAGVAGAVTTPTVLATATTAAKTTTLKYIGVALVGVVVVLALMIGIHVLIRLFHRVTGR